jgi:hypothetical protein
VSRIAPLQTRYAGCHFRSRLEARWAVFFDKIGIPWQYEPEGFDLGDAGAYLPDFLIYPNAENAMWFEVKGTFPTEQEVRKGQALSTGTNIPTCIYFGPLDLPAPASLTEMTLDDYLDRKEQWFWDDSIGWLAYPGGPPQWEVDFAPTAYMIYPQPKQRARAHHMWWTQCDYCGMVILKLHGQVGWCPRSDDDLPVGHDLYPNFGHATPQLQAAYTAARSARFEFGATGR